MSKASKTDYRRIARELAQQMGYELVEAGIEKEGAGQYLRFYLDSVSGISLDDCEAFHKRIQPLVEDVDYDFLEVSSPGVDRPIRTPAYAAKAVGQTVEIKLYRPLEGQKVFTGTFLGMDDKAYSIVTGQRELSFPIKDVALARRVIDVEQELAMADEPEQTQEETDEQ